MCVCVCVCVCFLAFCFIFVLFLSRRVCCQLSKNEETKVTPIHKIGEKHVLNNHSYSSYSCLFICISLSSEKTSYSFLVINLPSGQIIKLDKPHLHVPGLTGLDNRFSCFMKNLFDTHSHDLTGI